MANHAHTTSRRTLLAAPLAAAPPLAAVQAASAPPAAAAVPSAASSNPDAELIRVCEEHLVNLITYNRTPDKPDDLDACPLWAAYCRTRDVIDAAEPQTMRGILAKAWIARMEGISDCDPDGFSYSCHAWAWDLVLDLLRVGGFSDDDLIGDFSLRRPTMARRLLPGDEP